MVFLINVVEEVGILIKEEEVEEEITTIIIVLPTTMEDLLILVIQDSTSSHKVLKDLQVSLHLLECIVKSVVNEVIQLLIVIIEWTLHTKEGIHQLSWLQWLLILLKYRAAMVG